MIKELQKAWPCGHEFETNPCGYHQMREATALNKSKFPTLLENRWVCWGFTKLFLISTFRYPPDRWKD
jgi:hypothetical protein